MQGFLFVGVVEKDGNVKKSKAERLCETGTGIWRGFLKIVFSNYEKFNDSFFNGFLCIGAVCR